MTEGFDLSAYPSIPKKLWEYSDRLLADNPSHRLLKAIQRQGAGKTWRAINELFALAAQATNLHPDKLLERLGFNSGDLDSSNFQAMLGVLRAINQLCQLGFKDFEPLHPKLNRQEADFIASRGDQRYAVEVFRSSETAYRAVSHEKPSSDLATYIGGRVKEKLQQVSSTVLAHKCDRGIIVVVLDSQPAKALSSTDELQQVIKEAVCRLGEPRNTYLILFTGMADEYGKDEYVCFPSLPQVS